MTDVTIANGNGSYDLNGSQGGTITVGNGNDTVVVAGGSGQTITVGNGNDKLTVDGATGDTIKAGNGNDTVTVSGGSGNTIVVGNGNATVVASGDHGDTITVGNGNATVDLGANDTVTVGKGNDTLVLPSSSPTLAAPASITVLEDHSVGMGIVSALTADGFGQEKIFGFGGGNDKLVVSTAQFANFAAVLADAKQVGQNTVITADPSDTITLENFQLSSLKSSNVTFTTGASSGTVSLTISGVPSDATLSSAADPSGVSYNAATNTWAVAAGALPDLKLNAGEVTSATLTITATDSATGASISQTVALTVDPIAPTLTAPASLTVAPGQTVALGIAETPNDARDVVSLRIAGVPADATLSAGTRNSNGSWTLTPAQLTGLTLTAGAATVTSLTVTATNTLGITASTSDTIALTVASPTSIKVAISIPGGGSVQQGQSLLALATITGDAADLAAPVTYQWQSSSDGGLHWTNVAASAAGNFGGVAGSLYQLTEADEGKIFRAEASFTDDTGQAVAGASTPTVPVADITPEITVPFTYAVDDLKIVKNGTQIYDDTFSQAPPASPTILTNGVPTPIAYLTEGGTWTESGGKAVFSSAGAALNAAVAGGVKDFALLNTNTDPTSTLGLKLGASFTVGSTFDLAAPTSGGYGMELTDGTPTHSNDQLERLIVQRVNGNSVVELIQADLTTNTQTVVAAQTLTGAQLAGNTQIELQLTHAANAQTVSGSFELIDNGIVTTTVNFTPTASIFTNGVDWTRADVGAFTTEGVGLNVAPGQAVAAGQSLHASAAVNDADATIHYQWEKSNSAAFTSSTDIGTDNPNYVVQTADAGSFIRVVATTSDPDNSQSATATSQVTGAVGVPSATSDFKAVSQDDLGDDATSPASGNVLSNDSGAIAGDTLHVSAVNGNAAGVGNAVTGTYGTLILNPNGSYSYQLADGQANVDGLSFGQIVTDTFAYTATDSFGTSTSSTLNIVINPHNAAPVIVGAGTTATGAVTESPANVAETIHTITGTVAFTDRNLLDTHAPAIFVPAPGNHGNMSVALDNDSTGGTTGTATWTYTVSDAALDPLAQGQIANDTFDVLIPDANGGIAQQAVTITLTGSNDTPVVQTADQNLAFTEGSAAVFTAGGTSSFTDVDLADAHTVTASLQSAAMSNGAPLPSGLTATLASALSATLQNDDSQFVPGQYGWNFSLDNAAAEFLAQGEVLKVNYQIDTKDSSGGVGVQNINVAVTGANVAPVASPDAASVIEAGVQGNNTPYPGIPTATGNVLANDTDVNRDDTHAVSAIDGNAALVGTPLSGTYGTLTLQSDGGYTYALDPNSAALLQLASGTTATDVWTYTDTDNNGASSTSSLTVTVTGTLHAPTLNALAPAIADDDAPTPLTINASSAQGEPVTVTISGIPTGATLTDHYGNVLTGSSVTLTSDQLPGLTLTAGDAQVGSTVTLTVQAQATDGVSTAASAVQTLTIPIMAEPPALSVPSLITANANGAVAFPISAVGDADDVISVTISGIPPDASLSDNAGPLTVVNGSVTLTTAQLAGLSLHAGSTAASLTVTATNPEGAGASTSETVLLTVKLGGAALWGTAAYPVAPTTGTHVFAPAINANPTEGFGGMLVGTTSVDYNPAGPDLVTDSVVTFDPFMLPENMTPAALETSTISTFPFRYQIQWPNISATQAEGIAVYQTQDGSGNSYLNQVFVTRTDATSALSFSTPTQIEGPLTGKTENPVVVSFRNNTDGTLNSYSVAWDQYDPTAGTYTVNFQIFNPDGSVASPVETPISLTGVTGGVTSLPATLLRAGSGGYALAHPITNANGTESVQIVGFNVDGTSNGTTVTIGPNLSAFTAGAKNTITLEQNPTTHTLVTSALSYAQYSAATGNEYAVGWNETVTDSNGTHDQVEFAVFKPGTGVVSRTTFQVADGLPQDIKVQVQNDVAVLEFGDDTTTNVREFSSTGAQVGSLSVATTQAAQNILNFGDGRIGLVYDNQLDSSGTSQIVTDIYDFRTSGVSINDAALTDGVDKYVAGTNFNDSFVGEKNVDNTYAFVGNATTGAGPSDTFTGGSGGWNVAIMPDDQSNYTTNVVAGAFVLTSTDPLHAGSLALNNVQAIAYAPTDDPSGNPGSLTATGSRLEIIGLLPNGGEPITIADGATLELQVGDTGTVTFAGANGALQLDNVAGFTGAVAGFGAQDQLDLRNLVYDPHAATANFSENAGRNGGTLTVTSGATSANIVMFGDYAAADFVLANDGHGGTLLTDPSAGKAIPLATPHA